MRPRSGVAALRRMNEEVEMQSKWTVLAAAAVLAAGWGWAQEAAAPDREKQVTELRAKMNEAEKGMWTVRQRLGLGGGRGGETQDPELSKLLQTMKDAGKAYEEKVQALIKADPEGGKILAQMDETRAKINEMQTQLREMEKSMQPVRQKLGLAFAGGREAAMATTENADLAPLRQAMETARKALEEKTNERIKADPEGAKLMGELQEMRAKMQELSGRGRGEGREGQGQREPQAAPGAPR